MFSVDALLAGVTLGSSVNFITEQAEHGLRSLLCHGLGAANLSEPQCLISKMGIPSLICNEPPDSK